MKKVLITGGNGDIAKAVIDLLKSKKGYDCYYPSRIDMDVTSEESVNNYINKIGAIDILINNAGYIYPTKLNSTMIEDSNMHDILTIDVNLKGVFLVARCCIARNANLKIINIGSSAGTKHRSEWSSYCATKAAVIMASKCWFDEGVNVITLSPGRTVSKMRKALFPNEDQSTLMRTNDFAKVIIKYIENGYFNGENINVNVSNVKEILNEN